MIRRRSGGRQASPPSHLSSGLHPFGMLVRPETQGCPFGTALRTLTNWPGQLAWFRSSGREPWIGLSGLGSLALRFAQDPGSDSARESAFLTRLRALLNKESSGPGQQVGPKDSLFRWFGPSESELKLLAPSEASFAYGLSGLQLRISLRFKIRVASQPPGPPAGMDLR